MTNSPIASVEKHFHSLTDPRVEHSMNHLLIDIVIITICPVICDANNWVEIGNYGHAKKEWLETLLESPHGIPSYHTLIETICSLIVILV